MDKSLSRSKSLRLRPTPNENFSKPLPRADSLAYRNTRLAHDDTVIGGIFSGDASSAPTEPARPSTAGGIMHHSSPFADCRYAKVYTPSSPALLFAAEVYTNKPLPSPKSPGKAITTDDASSHTTHWPIHNASLRTPTPAERQEIGNAAMDTDSGPKLSRWRSFRGLFGRKNSQVLRPAPNDTTFENHYWDRDLRNTVPTRAATTSRANVRHERDAERARLLQQAGPVSSIAQPVKTYVPTGRPAMQQSLQPPAVPGRNPGFQGGHKYHGGTTTATTPMLDVEIPDVRLERYSVMFSGLSRANTEPTLLTRRQSRARRPTGIQPEPLQTPKLPYLDTKPCPPTPRSAAKYQLSLFPAPSPRKGGLDPLGMHKPRALQRAQTSPSPRSPRAYLREYQPSVSSNVTSEEVPVRLEVVPDEDVKVKPPTVVTNHEEEFPQGAVMSALLPATSLHGHSSFQSTEPETHVVGPWDPPTKEPAWGMNTQGAQRPRTSSDSTAKSAAFTAFSDDTAVDLPVVRVSVARQMSLRRAKSVKTTLEKERAFTPTLLEKRALTPTLVQLGHRANQKSHTVEIEGL